MDLNSPVGHLLYYSSIFTCFSALAEPDHSTHPAGTNEVTSRDRSVEQKPLETEHEPNGRKRKATLTIVLIAAVCCRRNLARVA